MRIATFVTLLLSLSLVACQSQKVSHEVPQVLSSSSHDPIAFTQGLEYYNGKFYESTGLYGQSTLREVDMSGTPIRQLRLSSDYFAEGLARVDQKLYQITWQEGKAFIYDLDTFNQLETFNYKGEGWGLCFDGTELYMSDGSSTLFKRDPDTFAVTKEITVTQENKPVERLNELECVDNYIYANVWLTDKIVKIDKASGDVVAEIDASQLLSSQERATLSKDAVLNGIAYNPDNDSFFVTGKLWPKLFEVKFIEKQ
ncbi:MAG: glutaminyl-peptide cyclotransferase [Trueperaceae bacterium]|nr:glutaminyl-peptide cyclotransferase [Trueperaceae bacterium]